MQQSAEEGTRFRGPPGKPTSVTKNPVAKVTLVDSNLHHCRLAWRPMLVEVMGYLRRLGNGQRSPEACISDGNPPEGLNLSFRCSQIWSLGPRSFFTLDSWIQQDPLKTLATGDAQQGIAGFKFSWLWRPCRFWVKAGRGDLTSADAGAVAVSGWGPLSLRLHRILRLHRLGLHRGIGLAVNSKPCAPVSALNSWGC